jgi:hypothetical protein
MYLIIAASGFSILHSNDNLCFYGSHTYLIYAEKLTHALMQIRMFAKPTKQVFILLYFFSYHLPVQSIWYLSKIYVITWQNTAFKDSFLK